MKRAVCLLLAILLCLSIAPAVRADVIYEPSDDFYEAHWADCDYVNRSYTANGPGGELKLYTSPKNSHVEYTVPNGESIYIAAAYTDSAGTEWGCAEVWEENITGWVPMDYVVKIYNFEDFAEEFADRIQSETGDLSAYAGQEIQIWSYPGDDSGYALTVEAEYAPDYSRVFTDNAGQKWGYCGYYFGHKNFWVCLDNPTADYDALYADHAPQQVTHPQIVEPTGEIKPGGVSPAMVLAAVAVVAVLSAAVLVGMKKKK